LNKPSIGRMKAQLAVSAPGFKPYDQLEIKAQQVDELQYKQRASDQDEG